MVKVKDTPFPSVGPGPGILGSGGAAASGARGGSLGEWLGRIARASGIDRAVAYTVLARGWGIGAGLVTLLLIAGHLTPAQQGYYYTFASILALQVFFELGLAGVIVQFASHEASVLHPTDAGTLAGAPMAKGRLASLLRMTLRWYRIAAVLLVGVALPAGFLFFARAGDPLHPVAWVAPWAAVVVATAANLACSPFFAVLEGCGQVAHIAMMRFQQGVVATLGLWLALVAGWGLFATVMVPAIGFVWGCAWLWRKKREFISDLLHTESAGSTIGWRTEIWPFQWKIAVSWISGYFIFQLFNPILFAYQGSVAAGQMGLSTSMMVAVATVGVAWLTTKAAPFGMMIARREFEELDRTFFRALLQSWLVVALGGAALWGAALYLWSTGHPLAQRILAPLPFGLLVATTLVNHVVGAEALYLRAHKQEPFLWISVVTALLVGTSSWLLGRSSGATGMMAGFLAVQTVMGLGAGTWIFVRKRREWHASA